MFGKGRTKELALLGGIALVLVLGAVSPAFAWNNEFSTTVSCSSSSTQPTEGTTSPSTSFTACSSTTSNCPDGASSCSSSAASVPSSKYVEDEAAVSLDGYTCSTNCGTINFYLVSGSTPESCPDAVPGTAIAEGSQTLPTSAAGTSEGTFTTTYWYSSTLSGLSSGTNYYFYVVYSPGSSGYPYTYHDCEPFTGIGGGSFSVPTPQFPLGVGLLLALSIPGLLLVRSRYTRKFSSSPVAV